MLSRQTCLTHFAKLPKENGPRKQLHKAVKHVYLHRNIYKTEFKLRSKEDISFALFDLRDSGSGL